MKKLSSIEIWEKFVELPGASVDGRVGIASEHAIHGVLSVIKRKKPKKILELGAGIGTLTYAILNSTNAKGIQKDENYVFYTIENNEYCLNQLTINLQDYKGLFTVLSSTNELPEDILFDFIVVDGGGDLGNDMGVMPFGNMLAPKGIILVEGGRAFQRKKILEWYANRAVIQVKSMATNIVTVSRISSTKIVNKPYHIFIFEPNLLDKVFIQYKKYLQNNLVKIIKRLS